MKRYIVKITLIPYVCVWYLSSKMKFVQKRQQAYHWFHRLDAESAAKKFHRFSKVIEVEIE